MGSEIPVPRGSPSPGQREGGGVARKGPQALPLPSPGSRGGCPEAAERMGLSLQATGRSLSFQNGRFLR